MTLPDGLDVECFHEPHVVELEDGRLLGLVRYDPNHHDYHNRQPGQTDFQMCQSYSSDGGKTWSRAEVMDFHGSPPHLLRLSGGVLVTTYGYREKPYGIRAMLSHDDGETWRYDYILRDDGPHPDLGYPSSVELGRREHFHRLLPAAPLGRRQVRPALEPVAPACLKRPMHTASKIS